MLFCVPSSSASGFEFPTSLSALVIFRFCDSSTPSGCRGRSHGISLVISDTEHLFIYLLASDAFLNAKRVSCPSWSRRVIYSVPFSKPDYFLEGMFKCLENKTVYSFPSNSPTPHMILSLVLSASFHRVLRVARALSPAAGWSDPV